MSLGLGFLWKCTAFWHMKSHLSTRQLFKQNLQRTGFYLSVNTRWFVLLSSLSIFSFLCIILHPPAPLRYTYPFHAVILLHTYYLYNKTSFLGVLTSCHFTHICTLFLFKDCRIHSDENARKFSQNYFKRTRLKGKPKCKRWTSLDS